MKTTHQKVKEQVNQLCCIKYKQSSLERAEQRLELSDEKKGEHNEGRRKTLLYLNTSRAIP